VLKAKSEINHNRTSSKIQSTASEAYINKVRKIRNKEQKNIYFVKQITN